jgi:isopenicillin-N epimerase
MSCTASADGSASLRAAPASLSSSADPSGVRFEVAGWPARLGEEWERCWPLDERYTFLNHGSFGSVPIPVLEAQRRYRDLVEARPIEILGRRVRELLAPVKERLASFLRTDAPGIGFVGNATEGVNAVLRSVELRPGDVLVTTDHVYRAVLQAMRFAARRSGAEVRVVPIPLPTSGADEIVERISAAIDARARMVVIDHVTSPTAVVFPVERIAAICRERGVDCLVDGAHAPGMLDLDLGAIGATYYTGNLHKWVCAPKGSAFLWADPARRSTTHPNIVSHFLDEGFDAEFDWQGTRDISSWLAIRDAIAFFEPLGWSRLREHNRDLAYAAREWIHAELCSGDGARAREPLTPRGDRGLLGSIATIELPASAALRWPHVEALQADLYERERIEVPIIDWGGRWHVRISAQAYNRPEQYRQLAEALVARVFT